MPGFLGFLGGGIAPFGAETTVARPKAEKKGFLGWLARLNPFGGKKPPAAPPEAPPEPPSPPTPENEDWLFSGSWVYLASSNVHAARYLWDEKILELQFKGHSDQGGYYYQYFNVPQMLAGTILSTASPGRWVWDHLRVRGTVTGYQYDYVRLTGFAGVSRTATKVGLLPEDVAQKRTGGNIPLGEVPAWMQRSNPFGGP